MKGRLRISSLSLLRGPLLFIATVGLNSCINLSEGRTDVVRYQIQVTDEGFPLSGARVRICNRQNGRVPDPASEDAGCWQSMTTPDGICSFELEIPVHTTWTHFGPTATAGFGGLRVRIDREGYAIKEFDVPVHSFVKHGSDFVRVEAIEMSK